MAYTPYVNPATRPEDLQPNAFSSVGGGGVSNQILAQWDFYRPFEWTVVMNRHIDKPGFGQIIRTMGFARDSQNPQVGHYEYPWRKDLVKIGSIVTPASGAGNDIVVALSADSMYDPTVTVSGTGRKASYPREGQIIKTITGEKFQITAKNITTDPHQLTLTPVDATIDPDAHVIAGENYFISDNAWGEATGLPTGVMPRFMKYSNTFQIVKERILSSGTELTNFTYFKPVGNQEGSYYLKVKENTIKLFEDQKDGVLVWGTQIDNITQLSTQLGHDVDVKGTEGLISFAEANSYEQSYAVGAFALSDFDEITDIYENERVAGDQILSLQGKALNNEIERVLEALLDGDMAAFLSKNWFAYDQIRDEVWGDQHVSPSDYAVMIGFRAIKRSGYTFAWKLLHEFNDVRGAGADGYTWRNSAIMMPVAYAEDMNPANGVSGHNRKMGTFGYEYKTNPQMGYSRESIVSPFNGAGVAGTTGITPMAVSEYDVHNVGFLSELAAHFTCANHIVLVRPA